MLGWQTATLPLFYTADGGPAGLGRGVRGGGGGRHRRRALAAGRPVGGLLLARPPVEGLDLEALSPRPSTGWPGEAITGQAVTPAILTGVEELSDGRSVEVNQRLIADNAELAARVAVAYAELPAA